MKLIDRTRQRLAQRLLGPVVEQVITERFGHMLDDVGHRIDQARALANAAGSVPGVDRPLYAQDLAGPYLRGPGHAYDGYTLTNNSPGAGSIAWADLHIVFNGTDYVITNANTALKYCWWSPTTTPTVLQTSNTKPTLAQGEVLVFVNNAGTGVIAISDTFTSMPGVIRDNAVDSGAILAGAVGNTALGTGLDAAKITTGALPVAQVPNLPGTKITSAVANATNATNATTAATATTVVDNAITQAKMADNAVGSAELLGGSVLATKLNIARHVFY